MSESFPINHLLDSDGNPKPVIDYGVVEVVMWEDVETVEDGAFEEIVVFHTEVDLDTIQIATVLKPEESK